MIEDRNTAYQQRPYIEINPHQGVVRLMAKLDKPSTSLILDLGCGDGRHQVFLAKQRYAPIGIDQAIWGLRRSKQWVEKKRLKTKLVCGHVSSLPLGSESIDRYFYSSDSSPISERYSKGNF